MDSSPPSPSSRGGVWGFVKRNVWGDVQSHPIAVSRSPSPEEAGVRSETAGLQTSGNAEPGSPFQSQAKENDPDDNQDESLGEQPSQSFSNTRVTMVSEPSLRYGLAEGKQPSTCVYISHARCPQDTLTLSGAERSGSTLHIVCKLGTCCMMTNIPQLAGIRQPTVLVKHDMDRAPSLASGIGSATVEWNPEPANPSQSRTSRSSSSAAENISISPSSSSHAADDQTSTSDAHGSEATSNFNPASASGQARAEDSTDTEMAEVEQGTQGQNSDDDFSLSPIHGGPPRLTPLRVTPHGHENSQPHEAQHEQHHPAQPPPPTSFPVEAVAARHGIPPEDLVQVCLLCLALTFC